MKHQVRILIKHELMLQISENFLFACFIYISIHLFADDT